MKLSVARDMPVLTEVLYSDIANDIGLVKQSSVELRSASGQVLTSSKELSAVVERLNQLIR